MKRVTTLLFASFFSIAVFASGGVNFTKNMTWAQVKALAAKEKKMIFFDAYTSWCGPCKYLERSVYTNASVAAFFNANFINVKFDMEKGEGVRLAEEYNITAYPTLLFFSPEGKPLHKFIGALDANDFLQLGKDAMDPGKQYFSLKQKVLTQKATRDDFVKWSVMADELDDNNRGTIASYWLTGQTDILGTADLAKTTMLYTDVNESQLTYLYQQQTRIQELLGWTAEKTATTLYRKLFQLAFQKVDVDKRDPAAFTAVISAYAPSKLNYALKDLQLNLVVNHDRDMQKAMEILAGSLYGPGRITLPEVCDLLIDHFPRFEKSDISKLIGVLNNYTFTSLDAGNEWGLYLAQVICHSKMENFTLASEFAAKAFRHPGLPEGYKPVLKESYGF